ncbi:MAG: hypothetical protein Q8L27_03470 [archaeon]|nr:hypothetical protein [archaeon]
MASTCKYCGADTWGRYQICPDCRGTRHRGRDPILKELGPMIVNGLPFLAMGYGYYQLLEADKSIGFFSLLLGILLWWGMIFSKRAREKFSDRVAGIKDKAKYESLNNKSDKTGIVFFLVGVILTFFFVFYFVNMNSSKIDTGINNSDSFGNQNYTSTIQQQTLQNNNLVVETLTGDNSAVETPTLTPQEQLKQFCTIEFTNMQGTIISIDYFEDYGSASSWLDTKYPNEGITINRARFFKEDYLDKSQFPVYLIEGKVIINANVASTGLYACDKTGIIKK